MSENNNNSSSNSKLSEMFAKYKHWRAERKRIAEENAPKTPMEKLISMAKTILGAIVVVMVINGLLVASFVVPTGSMENTVMTGDFLFVNKFMYGPSTPQIIPFLNIPLPFYKFPGIKDPEKGDVIVFIYPGDRDEVEPKEFQYYLKRCIATAGDSLRIVGHKVLVNGKEFHLPEHAKYDESVPDMPAEQYSTFPVGRGYTKNIYGPIRIPKKGDRINLTLENLREWEVFIKREGKSIDVRDSKIYIDNQATNSYTVERDYCFAMGDNRDHSLDSRYWGFVPYDNVVGTPMMIYWSWEARDEYLNENSFGEKIKNIRWSRLFSIIN